MAQAGSPVDQAGTINTNLAQYFDSMQKFSSSSDGSAPLPDFNKDVIEGIDYSELLRMTTTCASDAASYTNGAAIENVNHMVALNREFGLRSKTKLQYYADAQSDYLNESNFYAAMSTFWTNMMIGAYTDGKTS